MGEQVNKFILIHTYRRNGPTTKEEQRAGEGGGGDWVHTFVYMGMMALRGFCFAFLAVAQKIYSIIIAIVHFLQKMAP